MANKHIEILRYAMVYQDGEELDSKKPWLMIKVPGIPRWYRIFLGVTQSSGVWADVYETQDTRERCVGLTNVSRAPTSMEIINAIKDVAYAMGVPKTNVALQRLRVVRDALDRYVEQGAENESK